MISQLCNLLTLGSTLMNYPPLPPADLPPPKPDLFDRYLHRQLEASLNQYFYTACDRFLKTLLSQCDWYITTKAEMTTLAIRCPNLVISWLVLKNLGQIESLLEALGVVKICVSPPPEQGTPLEVRVDEISIYRESL